MKLLLAVLFCIMLSLAQTPTHSATLTWTDPNPAGGTYSVYRATGLCSGNPAFTKIQTGVTALTYTDTTVTPGNYCYEVTVTLGGIEAAPSNSMVAAITPFALVLTNVSVK